MAAYDPAEYWNGLSGSRMRLAEVGWPNWTEAYNAARYQLALEQISAALDAHCATPPRRIVEVGCGVGFWTEMLLRRFPRAEYTGVDISCRAVERLAERHAGESRARFVCADVSEATLPAGADLVVCFEVLLHIVDDARWRRAVAAIGACVAAGGLVLISDPVSVHAAPPQLGPEANCRMRHLDEWERLLREQGLELLEIQPRTLLLDNNFDFRSRAAAQVWRQFFRVYNRVLSIPFEPLGAALGRVAYHVDRRYARRGRMGHSCKLLVLRKRADARALPAP